MLVGLNLVSVEGNDGRKMWMDPFEIEGRIAMQQSVVGIGLRGEMVKFWPVMDSQFGTVVVAVVDRNLCKIMN